MSTRILAGFLALAAACAACQKKQDASPDPASQKPAQVTLTRIVDADSEPGNWLTHGRTYSEQRFSPLTADQRANVSELGLAWSLDLDTHRGQEATPLVVDGVMYSTSAWSKVYAHRRRDAASCLWQYDPQVPGETGVKACCDVVNRGVAACERQALSSARSTAGWSRSMRRPASRVW